MKKFEEYLINKGMHYHTAYQYSNIVAHYLKWVKDIKSTPSKITRKKFSEFIQYCREAGNSDRTILSKEVAIKQYYNFLGTKHNPAKSWIPRKKEWRLPPQAIEPEQLMEIYQSLDPKTPAEYRDRCMLGLVLFQGLLRAELTELRISDIDFSGYVFVQGQSRSNSRSLKLEPIQVIHLYDYLQKYRKHFLGYRKEDTDRFFLSSGTGSRLDNSLVRVTSNLRKNFPFVKNLRHIRGSVISKWDKEEGVIEAMVKAGHRYISSTARFQNGHYEELKDQLKSLHPLENMDLKR